MDLELFNAIVITSPAESMLPRGRLSDVESVEMRVYRHCRRSSAARGWGGWRGPARRLCRAREGLADRSGGARFA